MAETDAPVAAAAAPVAATDVPAAKKGRVAKAPKAAKAPKPAVAAAGAKKPKTGATPAEHPLYATMVMDAIKAVKERSGASRQAVTKFVLANYTVGDAGRAAKRINLALKKLLEAKKIVHGGAAGRKGAGSFKITTVEKKAKPAVKKPAAKKASAKSPKKSVKKPKVAKSPKPKVAKKPKAAKSPKPKAAKKPKVAGAAKPKAAAPKKK
jgi:histone H1/5